MAALARSSFQAFALDSKSICSGFNLSLDSNSICSGFKHSPRRVEMAPISLPSHHRTCSETRCCSRESNNLALFESSRRKAVMTILMGTVSFVPCDEGRSVSTSKRALRSQKIPESEFTTLSNGLKYYDLKVGSGPEAVKGSRVALHYVVKWKGVTFMTSRQGMGVTGGTPYGFDVGASENGSVLKGLDLGVQGMRVGGQRLLIVPPELAYGNKGIQEIPPNATLEFDLELLSIKQSPFGSSVKLVEG